MMDITFTQESHYLDTMRDDITPFWNKRQHGFLNGEHHTQLHWVSFTSPTHKKAIMIVNGRIESVYKYQELFYDLFNQGFDIFSFDHRGQGLSDRLTENNDIGHITDFNEYVLDLDTVTRQLIIPEHYQDCYLLGHSMGGTIATRYIETYSHPYTALALCAPMHGIHMQPWLKPIASPISRYLSQRSVMPSYALGQHPYRAKPFLNNLLTSCEVRYQWFRDLYQAQPELQIGGPSNHWVNQGILSAKLSIEHADQCDLPTLLMQGEEDKIVDNNAHILFQQAAPNCELVTIKEAKHELLFESDPCRNHALQTMLSFFEEHKTN